MIIVMDLIPLDIWGYITIFIKNDKEKCYLMMACKEISKCKFYFNDIVRIEKILKSTWFDYFTNILVRWEMYKLPLNTTYLTIGAFFNKSIENYIHYGVKYLKF